MRRSRYNSAYSTKERIVVRTIKLLTLFLGVLAFSNANAEKSGTYVGFDFANMIVNFPQSVTTPEWKHTERMARARIGVVLMPDLFPGLALESHLAMGASEESVTYDSPNQQVGQRDVDLKLETIMALYLRSDFYSDNDTSMYGLLGLASAQSSSRHVDIPNDSDGITEPETQSGVSFGLGFTYAFSESVTMQMEYLSVVRKDSDLGFDVSGVSVGFNFAFDKDQ